MQSDTCLNAASDTLALVLDKDCFNFSEDPLTLVACVRDFHFLTKLRIICVNEGFPNLHLSYLGVFWVLLKCQSIQVCHKFKIHEGINYWFSNISK